MNCFGSDFVGGFGCARADFVDFEATPSWNNKHKSGVIILRHRMQLTLQLQVLDL
jgi:hypothetical protein